MEADFHGERRSNETQASTTAPDGRLYKKGKGKEAKLCFMGYGLMENRHGLLVDAYLTEASGYAERVAALHMIEPFTERTQTITLGADKAYDTKDFVKDLRSMKVTPHVAQNINGRRSAIDGRSACAEFSWEGQDESEPACGRGWAVLGSARRLAGYVYIHNGDASGFVCERD